MHAVGAAIPGDLVLFVHGTFAYDDRDAATPKNRDRWWQRDSDFAAALAGKLPGYQIVPAGERVSDACRPWWWGRRRHKPIADGKTIEAAFHWSGLNSESARRTAGRRLLEHIDRLVARGSAGQRIHLVGHSHGGAVIWEALRLAHLRESRNKDVHKIVDRVQTWVTVATPFLRYGANWSRLPWQVLCLTSFVCIIFYECSWWTDFWQQQPAEFGFLGHKYLGFTTIHLGILVFVLFALQMLWNLFRWLDSRAGESQEKEQCCYDFLSSLFANACAWAAMGILMAIANSREVNLWSLARESAAWTPAVVGAQLLSLAVIVGLLISIWGTISVPLARQSKRDAHAAPWPPGRCLPKNTVPFPSATRHSTRL